MMTTRKSCHDFRIPPGTKKVLRSLPDLSICLEEISELFGIVSGLNEAAAAVVHFPHGAEEEVWKLFEISRSLISGLGGINHQSFFFVTQRTGIKSKFFRIFAKFATS